MKLRFKEQWKEYIVERVKDNEARMGTGIVGNGIRVLKGGLDIKAPEDSILMMMESKAIKDEKGQPLTFIMHFTSEEDAYKYLSFSNGGSIQHFYPDRDKGFVEVEAKE